MAKVIKLSRGSIGFDELKKRIAELDKLNVFVGWLESAQYDDGTPVAGIAAVQEYGSVKRSIPPRPFFRPAVDSEGQTWIKIIELGAKSIIKGNSTALQVMEKLGLKASGDVKVGIKNANTPALSPVTIALRKLRNENDYGIGGAFVGFVAAAIAAGKTGPGELGDQSFGNKTPLNDTGYMIATVTYEVQSGN